MIDHAVWYVLEVPGRKLRPFLWVRVHVTRDMLRVWRGRSDRRVYQAYRAWMASRRFWALRATWLLTPLQRLRDVRDRRLTGGVDRLV